MRALRTALALLAHLAGFVSLSTSRQYPREGSVLVLDDLTLDSALEQYPNVFLEFYAPWCGMCQKFQPKWMLMAKKYEEKGIDVVFGIVNAESSPKAAAQYSVSGYPALILISDGHRYNFDGGYEEASLDLFLTRIIIQPVIHLERMDERIENSDRAGIILHSGQTTDDYYYYRLAAKNHQYMDFFALPRNAENTERMGNITNSTIFILRRRGRKIIPFTGRISHFSVDNFFTEHK